ncbi:outer membrane lipoprotein Omp16 [Agrobacterium vitis]|uniref:Outer membrane lipoprotein n=2 Tax=Rhizobium/Agrobacterium group TaxID=227290 RepID=B9JS38_ALLAM|nr:outer membrane lipoprotein [Allorhizobium ampelinum S4]BCH58396.1 outer membrane lipoprotein Omp16 [Agrobacterium vitis]BCH63803.1 outer membrane lipoprotein Omp16 [Agrobacterium vitis]
MSCRMETVMKVKSIAILLVAAFAVSSCVGTPPPRQVAYNAPQPQGVDGAWVDPNGIVSTFQGGTFATRSSDTNALLASGTYTNTSPTLVEINMTSLVRKTQSRVNCALVSPEQLNCTTDAGSNFSLRRKI